jgi:Flp pilus assembly pilin Flp
MKFFSQKRGQAAIEYIAILTIVVVIAVVIVAVLSSFPTQASGVSVSQSEAYWTSAEIGLSEGFFTESGGRITVRNNRPYALSIINVSDVNGDIVNGTGFVGILQPGESLSGALTFPAGTCNEGSSFNRKFFIAYKNLNGNVYNFSGKIALAGRCQA